jgi:hypothetical protein
LVENNIEAASAAPCGIRVAYGYSIRPKQTLHGIDPGLVLKDGRVQHILAKQRMRISGET